MWDNCRPHILIFFLLSDRLLDKVRQRLAQAKRQRKAPNREINYVDLGVDLEDDFIEAEWCRNGTRAGKTGLFNFTLHGICLSTNLLLRILYYYVHRLSLSPFI